MPADVLLIVSVATVPSGNSSWVEDAITTLNSLAGARVPKRVQLLATVNTNANATSAFDAVPSAHPKDPNRRVWLLETGPEQSVEMSSPFDAVIMSDYRRIVIAPLQAGDRVGREFLCEVSRLAMEARRYDAASNPLKVAVPHQFVGERSAQKHAIKLLSFDPSVTDRWLFIAEPPYDHSEIVAVASTLPSDLQRRQLNPQGASFAATSTPPRPLSVLRGSLAAEPRPGTTQVVSESTSSDDWELHVQDVITAEPSLAFQPLGSKFAIAATRDGNKILVNSNLSDTFGAMAEICYYARQGSKRVDRRWYTTDTRAEFKDLPPRITIRGFVRKDGVVIAQVDSGVV